MSNIIKFPKTKRGTGFYNEELTCALAGLEPNLRSAVENILESIFQKYSSVCEPLEMTFHGHLTNDDIEAIKSLFVGQQSMIKELINDLALAKIEYEIQKQKNS